MYSEPEMKMFAAMQQSKGMDARVLGGATLAGGNQIKPASEMEHQLCRMESEISLLHGVINALSERLEGILVPSAPCAGNEAGMVEGAPGSQLGQQISSLRRSIADANARIQDMLSRLAL